MEGRRTSQSTHASLNSEAPPPFLSKTYDMVEDPSTDRIVSWGPGDNSFVVWNPPEFATNLLPKYFKHNNFSSFVRQLNTYGFRKIDPDRWEFANEGFLRGQKHLLKRINRRKYSHVHNQQQQHQAQSSSVGACVEVGKFGVEGEIEGLKRDKNVLMQELVRLRQQQQASDHQLQILGQRLQRMEQHQQQMMSFLAKAMQSPGYLAQLVHQNDSSRRIAGVKKKRRLPMQEDDLNGNRDPTGQIIKYQPLINEAAKAMLMQKLKMDLSPRMEASDTPDGFLIDNVPSSPEPASTESSWSQISSVTLDEAPTSYSLSNLMVSSGFPSSAAAMSEIQSSAPMSNMVTTAPSLSDVINSNIGEQETLTPNSSITSIPDFPQLQRVPEGNVLDIPSESFVVHGTDSKLTNSMEMGVDRTMPIEPDEFSGVTEMDNFFDGLDNDVSWEQLILPDLISEDACECESNTNSTEGIKSQPWQENGWSNAQRLEHLTEQLGLLTSEGKG